MVLGFNEMTDEEFSVEVKNWKEKRVFKTLKSLKNCDKFMRLIDMFDASKFEILQARFG